MRDSLRSKTFFSYTEHLSLISMCLKVEFSFKKYIFKDMRDSLRSETFFSYTEHLSLISICLKVEFS